MNKVYRYILLAVLIAFLGYNSVYFRKLSEVKNQKISGTDFTALADSLYYKGILKTTKTVDLPLLFNLIQIRPDSAFKDYGKRIRYTLVLNLSTIINAARRGWY